MSDEESDWSSDGDDGADLPSRPAAKAAPSSAGQAKAASPAPAASAAAPVQRPKTELPEKQIFLALPVQMVLQTTVVTPKPQLAGAAIIYTSQDNSWKIMFYDDKRRPVILEPLSADSVGSSKKTKECNAPCDFELQEGPFATIVDNLMRTWRVQFQTRVQSFRYLTFLAVSVFCLRAINSPAPFCKVEVIKGQGKVVKAKYYAQCVCRVWRVEINSEAPNLSQPLPPFLANFEPQFEDSSSLFVKEFTDVLVGDHPDGVAPTTLGEAISKIKVEGQRLVVVPASGPVGRELIQTYNAELEPTAPKLHEQTLCAPGFAFVISVTVGTCEKKALRREKKEKKEKKPKKEKKVKEGEAAAVSSPAGTKEGEEERGEEEEEVDDEEGKEVQVASATASARESMSTSSSSSSSSKSSAGLEADVEALVGQLQSLAENVNSLPDVQTKLLKFLLGGQGGLYEQVVADCDLDAEKQALLKSRVAAVVTAFQDKNQSKAPTPGTIKNSVLALRQLLKTIEPFVSKGGVLTPEGLRKLAASGGGEGGGEKEKKKIASLEGEKKSLSDSIRSLTDKNKELEKENASVRAQLDAMGEKQMSLASSTLAMEEKVAELTKQNRALASKVETLEVFEKGLNDMSGLLANEAATRNKLEEDFEALSKAQQRLKLTWIPLKSTNHCLLCRDKFKMFGAKSRHYCRYCGRIFCAACTTNMEIPEFGYVGKQRVCTSCFEFRSKVEGGGSGGGGAGAPGEDDLEEE